LKAVILAGGFGKRLKPLTDDRPKPMIGVGGYPILVWQLDWLRRNKIAHIIICVGHLHEVISKYVGDGEKFGVEVEYSIENEPLGTAGALRNASSHIDNDYFFVVNGDTITDLDPWKLEYDESRNLGCIATVQLRSPYGIVEIMDNLATGFREKPIIPEYWINAGIYRLSHSVLGMLPERGNIESTTLPQLAAERKLRVRKFDGINWKSIDTHKDVEEAQLQFQSLSPNYVKDKLSNSPEPVAR
jgi:mannose-1-phosphate guanylyltransferase